MLYCLIYNLNSSSGRKSKFINRVLSKLKENNSVDYFETKTINQAEKIFKDFNQKNYDRLIVAGGDGSVSFAINELIKNDFNFKEDFAIGYIPAGTANTTNAGGTIAEISEKRSCSRPTPGNRMPTRH